MQKFYYYRKKYSSILKKKKGSVMSWRNLRATTNKNWQYSFFSGFRIFPNSCQCAVLFLSYPDGSLFFKFGLLESFTSAHSTCSNQTRTQYKKSIYCKTSQFAASRFILWQGTLSYSSFSDIKAKLGSKVFQFMKLLYQ